MLMLQLCMDPFHQTIGHEGIKRVLNSLLADDRLPQAFLFVGASHLGKTHVVKALIARLFDAERPLEAMLDVVVLKRERDPKTQKRRSQISVKQVRQLTTRLSHTSLTGSWKVAFIEEADHLSIGAANALLKTLEEPTGKTLILLRARSVEAVLPTIASRCQTLRFTPVARTELAAALEKRGLSKTEALTLATRARGLPGMAIRYVTDSQWRAQKETAQHQARTLFSAPLYEQFKAVNELIPKTEMDKSRILLTLIDNWSEILRGDLLQSIGCVDWSVAQSPTKKMDTKKTVRMLNTMQNVRGALKHNLNPHLALEHIFLSAHL